jgi:hypothetical protein
MSHDASTNRFVRRPVEVIAIQAVRDTPVMIASGETMIARSGDWIITNPVDNATWVCEYDKFEQLYSPVHAANEDCCETCGQSLKYYWMARLVIEYAGWQFCCDSCVEAWIDKQIDAMYPDSILRNNQ